jgi:guanylate kinase
MATGTLFIISAPSGAGKTSLLRALVMHDEHVRISVSHTTRAKRPGEMDGVDYHFVNEEEFQRKVEAGDFLEHATVFDYHYGTCKDDIDKELAKGMDVILEIDWQGAQQVRKAKQDTVSIFILPPDKGSLVQRLTERKQDSEAVIQRRTLEAQEEISHYSEFDYLVVNDVFEHALDELRAILIAQRMRLEKQALRYRASIDKMLA